MAAITGIGHIALKVHDIGRSLDFYRDRLGFPEMMRIDKPEGGLWLVYLRVTDEQFIEIFPRAGSRRGSVAGYAANGAGQARPCWSRTPFCRRYPSAEQWICPYPPPNCTTPWRAVPPLSAVHQ